MQSKVKQMNTLKVDLSPTTDVQSRLGAEIIASFRTAEEDSLPLLGTWQHGRHTKQYEIQQTEDGRLFPGSVFSPTRLLDDSEMDYFPQGGVLARRQSMRLWEGPHIFGGTLVGVLYEEAEWLRAELCTCKD